VYTNTIDQKSNIIKIRRSMCEQIHVPKVIANLKIEYMTYREKKYNMFENQIPIHKDKLNDQIFNHLCTMLREGEFKPGQAVPVSQITKAFGVSAMPVREALTQLLAIGVLDNVSGRTVGVPALGLAELKDLRDVRLEVESLATKWAVENQDQEFLDEMHSLVEKLENAYKSNDIRAHIKANFEFHFRLYKQSNSQVLMEVINTLWLRVSPHLYHLEPGKDLKVSNDHHKRIVQSIMEKNPEGAVAALRDDINDAYDVLLSPFSNPSS